MKTGPTDRATNMDTMHSCTFAPSAFDLVGFQLFYGHVFAVTERFVEGPLLSNGPWNLELGLRSSESLDGLTRFEQAFAH